MAATAVGLLGFVWILRTQLVRLNGLTAPGWDLGQEQQLLWSLAYGHGWISSYEHGKNFLSIHVEPILLLVAAVERTWPTPVVPLVFAAAAMAAAAPAAYLMFHAVFAELPGGRWLALALGAPVPFWAASQAVAADQFHPEMLALAPAMLSVWAGLQQRRLLFWVLTVLTLACKEDQSYTVVVAALVVRRFSSPQIRRDAHAAIAVALVWIGVSVLTLRIFWNGAETRGLAYYQWMWQGRHNYFFDAVVRPEPWLVLIGLLVSVAGLPLLAPRWLLLTAPPLAASLFSAHVLMETLGLHYVLLLIFPMLAAASVGGRRLLELAPWRIHEPTRALVVAMPALVLGFGFGMLPPALHAEAWLYSQPSASERLLKATAAIPAYAPVAADDGAVVWLSSRPEVGVLYDDPAPQQYVVIDRLGWARRQDPGYPAALVSRLQQSGRRLMVDDGRFMVWSSVYNLQAPGPQNPGANQTN